MLVDRCSDANVNVRTNISNQRSLCLIIVTMDRPKVEVPWYLSQLGSHASDASVAVTARVLDLVSHATTALNDSRRGNQT